MTAHEQFEQMIEPIMRETWAERDHANWIADKRRKQWRDTQRRCTGKHEAKYEEAMLHESNGQWRRPVEHREATD